ncbi:MAG: hypothetical protein AMXMBFR53_27610 [Gemmatimonadota bacterium]
MDDLEKALAAASDEAILEQVRRGRWAAERPAPLPRRGSEASLLALLALVVAVGVVLPARFGSRPDDEARQADLRWTVEAVAEQVEAFRRRHGRLPAPGELSPPLSEAVRYRPDGEHYTVVGRVGTLEVVLDSWTRTPPAVDETPEELDAEEGPFPTDSTAAGRGDARDQPPEPDVRAPPSQTSWALRTAALARVRKMEGSSGLRM